MEVKVIGTNCKNGMQLFKMASRAIEDNKEDIKLEKSDDIKDIKKYGINNIPGLVIDDKLVSQGKVLTQREISKLL